MGGSSSSTQTQQSQTNPWAPAQGALNGILGQVNSSLSNNGVTPAQNSAINTITNNGSSVGQYAPAVNNYTQSMFNGGGALNQAGAVNNTYQQYYNATNPLASNTNYDPMSTPGIGDQLSALKDSITQDVNGSFAAAGRDGSPANSRALATGLTQGLAPILTGQYNQNVQNQQGAAGNLYNSGNTTSGILSGLQQLYNTNQGTGLSSISAGQDALNSGANNTLNAQQTYLNNLGLLSGIGTSIAGLGGTSSGTGTTQNQMSGAQQFATILGGLGSLFGKK